MKTTIRALTLLAFLALSHPFNNARAFVNLPEVGQTAPDFELKSNESQLGVSVDSAEIHQEFCTKEGLSFKLLADTVAKVSAAYGSVREYQDKKLSARNTFIIDPQGKIAKVFPGVKVAKHSEEVLAALAELQKK